MTKLLTGNVPGNEASNAETSVFGNAAGSEIKDSMKRHVKPTVRGSVKELCRYQKTVSDET
jgi:hypothetical protein